MHREWRAFRYDRDILTAAGKSHWSGYDTSVPLTAVGEKYMRGAEEFYIQGMGFHSHEWGNMMSVQDYDIVASYLDRLAERGINAVSLFMPDAYGGLVASGNLMGRWRGPWVSEDVNAGVPISNAYNDLFWLGDPGAGPGVPGSLGFDRFFRLLAERGMYANLRFDWPQIHTRYGATIGSLNPKYQGLWWLDGTSGAGEPDMRSITLNHMLKFVNQVNHLTGLTYGQDPTLFQINSTNELGIEKFYFVSDSQETFNTLLAQGGASTVYVHAIDARFVAWHNAKFATNPRWGAADAFVTVMPRRFAGSTAVGVNARPALAFDDNYGATATDDTNGQFTQRKRVAQFWEEMAGDMHAYFSQQLKAACPHLTYLSGQAGYISHHSNAAADAIDIHGYAMSSQPTSDYNGNPNDYQATFTWAAGVLTAVSASAPSEGWQVGLVVRVVKDTGYNLSTINVSRWTPGAAITANRFIIAIEGEAVWKANNSGTTSAIGAGPTGPGPTFADGGVTWTLIPSAFVEITEVVNPTTFRGLTAIDFSSGAGVGVVVIPGGAAAAWWMGKEPIIDTSDTLVVTRINGVDTDLILPGTLAGDPTAFQGGLLSGHTVGLTLNGKPATNTELGRRGVYALGNALQFVDHHLNFMYCGHAGAYYFTTIGPDAMGRGGEHYLQGHSIPWLSMELVSLIKKNAQIQSPPTVDLTTVTLDDLYSWGAKRVNASVSGKVGNNITPGWAHFVTSGSGASSAWVNAKTRYQIGAVASKTSVAYPNIQGAAYTPPWASDPEFMRVVINTNAGWMSIETPYFQSARGRLSGAGYDLDKLWFKPADGKNWYGLVALVSENGLRLDDPACEMVLYQWATGMATGGSFTKLSYNWTLVGDQQNGYGLTPVDWVDPGVLPRRGLDVKIKIPNLLAGRRLTNGKFQRVPNRYRDGGVWIRSQDPRLFLSASVRTPPLPEWIDFAPPTTSNVALSVSYQFNAIDAASYSVASGALPAGLTLSAGGLLDGTCTAEANYTFTVAATNVTGSVNTGSLSINVGPVLATMTLDFMADGALPAGLSVSRVTTGTGASAQRIKADGTFESIADNLPRWDYDRNTHALLGLLNEGAAATNLLLNSDAGAGQGVSVTSGTAYYLTFYAGTGVSVNWSGAATGSANGLGANIRQRVAITPGSTGTLTFAIVGGAVDHWQFEAATTPSNYAKSGAGQAVRGAEKINTIASAVPGYNATEGTFYFEYVFGEPSTGQVLLCLNQTAVGYLDFNVNYQGKVTVTTSTGGVQTLASAVPSPVAAKGDIVRVVFGYNATTGKLSNNGATLVSGSLTPVAAPNSWSVGNAGARGAGIAGATVRHMRRVVYWPVLRSDADLIALANGSLAP